MSRYFRRERAAEIAERARFIDELLIRFGWLEVAAPPEPMSELQAVQLLQAHERARQGRLRAHFMREIRQLKEKSGGKATAGGADAVRVRSTGLMAAMRIQKVWRGFTERRKTRRRKLEEMYLIGMIPEPPPTASDGGGSGGSGRVAGEAEAVEARALERRLVVQREFDVEYERQLVETKEELQLKRGTAMTEQIADEVRLWFRDYQERTGKWPEFPSDEAGGSRHLLSRQATESEMSVKSSAVSSKDSKKREKSRSPTKSGDMNVEESYEDGFKTSQSMFLSDIRTGIEE